MVGFLRFIIYRAIYSAVKGWRGVGRRNPRDAIAMNMESGEQRERRFYECSGGYEAVRSGPRSHDTTAIFAMLIISRDFIMDVRMDSWWKASRTLRSPLVFQVCK